MSGAASRNPPTVPPSTIVSLAPVAAAYFGLQGALVLAWWLMLWLAPGTRAWFTPPGWPQSTLTAFWLPDLALAAGGSLAAAWLTLRSPRTAGPARWFVAGTMAYGALFCLGASLATGGAWLSVALMVPAALASFALALLASMPPERLFRPARPAGAGRNVARTLGQCMVVWSVTLAILPLVLLRVEAELGLARAEWPGQRRAAVALFFAFGALNLWTGLTLATVGQGTPLPLEAPRRLVVRGPYAYVRNPMAAAGLGQGLAIALGTGSWLLLGYVAAGALAWNYGLRPSEERDLLRRFGDAYADYQRRVRCWIPSPRPYPRINPSNEFHMMKRGALLLVLLLQSACTPFFLDDGCGPVQRFTTANGEFRDGAAHVATATVSVGETRHGGSSLGAVAMGARGSVGAPLRGHVLRVRLVNAATGATLAEFRIEPAPVFGDEVIGATSVPVSDPADIKRVLLDGGGALLLDTDLDGRQFTAPLTEVYGGGWSRASCS